MQGGKGSWSGFVLVGDRAVLYLSPCAWARFGHDGTNQKFATWFGRSHVSTLPAKWRGHGCQQASVPVSRRHWHQRATGRRCARLAKLKIWRSGCARLAGQPMLPAMDVTDPASVAAAIEDAEATLGA